MPYLWITSLIVKQIFIIQGFHVRLLHNEKNGRPTLTALFVELLFCLVGSDPKPNHRFI